SCRGTACLNVSISCGEGRSSHRGPVQSRGHPWLPSPTISERVHERDAVDHRCAQLYAKGHGHWRRSDGTKTPAVRQRRLQAGSASGGQHQPSSRGCPFNRRVVSTGTGLARAPCVKQLSRATCTRRAILSLGSSDSTSTCTSTPRLPL